MPFDGIVAKSIVEELSSLLVGGRIEKIFQPEADEIAINIRAWNVNYKLVLSASANYPRIHLTDDIKENPAAPPVFCMMLRKHLSGGKILGFEFHNYERIIGLVVEAANELGDVSEKKLIIEIMGRYSNIILVNSESRIIDSIKHVDTDISRVREIMPARPYVLPPAQDKTIIDDVDTEHFFVEASTEQLPIEKYILEKIKGFSPMLCKEICQRAETDVRTPASSLTGIQIGKLTEVLQRIACSITGSEFSPCIIYEDEKFEKPLDFHCLEISQHGFVRKMESMNKALDLFYSSRDRAERMKQKKSDLLRALNTALDRCNKKLSIQQETLRDVADREKLRLYGELVTANIYCMPKNVKTVSLLNYYSEAGEYVEIPLDENLLPQENAQRYFKKYAKAKSTFTNTSRQLEETIKELEYLESVLQLLENCVALQEIDEVRQELSAQGYFSLKKKQTSRKSTSGRPAARKSTSKKPASKKPVAMSKPLRFQSSDGLEILVGKNNRQNDYLTLKLASSNDIWLHTKSTPGSHVIIRKERGDIPDSTLTEAAILAAWHSKARMSSGVQVDYTTVKNVNKPSGAKPGMVIYVNYRTIVATPDGKIVEELKTDKGKI